MAKSPVVRAGPFAGVFDPSDVGTARPTRLFDLRNMLIPDPALGSPAVARHGFLAQPQQLGAGDAARHGQGTHLHRRLDGTLDRFVFAGGRMYAWDGGVVYTDVTPTTITIDPVSHVFAATFDDTVVISDEVNKPWVYDPKAKTGVTIKYNTIDEQWNTKGGPVIYSGRVVFIVQKVGAAILDTETSVDLFTETGDTIITEALQGFQNTIAWSAALDATQGYDQDNYDNTWTLTQASSELLTGLAAEEAALVYYRLAGISYITGKIEDDFRTSSTVDAIATTLGQDSPAAILSVDTGGPRKIWFCDLDGRVHRMSPTGVPEELWRPMRRTVERQAGTAACRTNVAAFARASYHPSLKLVLFTLWDDRTLYVFDAKTGQYLGTWGIFATGSGAGSLPITNGIHVTAMGSLVDAVHRAVFVVLGSSGYVENDGTDGAEHTHGTVWRQKFPDDLAPWRDSPSSLVSDQPVPFERAIETHWLQHAPSLVFRALSAVATVIGDAVAHKIGLAYTVPASGRASYNGDPLVALSSKVRPGPAGEPAVSSVNWGLGRNAQGSAIRLRISAEEWDSATYATDIQFGVHDVEAEIQTVKARRNAL